ncbi:MAG: zinc ribbon domain-containing protein [Acholeplasmataceae bacterium]|nr:zinc ribbon domain-containing protein [Acholeplasmataceae bacterium]
MNYCNHCGEKVNPGQEFCFNCGSELKKQGEQSQQTGQYYQKPSNSQSQDSGSPGWGILGFCIPLVGLILWIVWKDDRPRDAKSAGVGALISVLVTGLMYIIYFIILAALLSGM